MRQKERIIELNKPFDPELRSYMLKVYNYMSIGLIITGITALITIKFPPLTNLLFVIDSHLEIIGLTPVGVIITFLPLLISIYFFISFQKVSINQAQFLFWLYAALLGMSLAQICFIYTMESIASTFFITASVFGITSLYGYNTNADLTASGSFMLMGLIAIIIASLVNLLLKSSAIYYGISFIGVFLFIGLTAWDTQKLKSLYYEVNDSDLAQKLSIVGALTLYLDFINLFLSFLRFLGRTNRKSK